MKYYDSLVDCLTHLKSMGYDAEFEAYSFCLYCGALDLRLNPEQFTIDEVCRFEGNSNPDDSPVLFAISSYMGVKGTLVDWYGPYEEKVSFDIAQKLRKHYT